MKPVETLSVFEAAQNASLMDGLCLVTESTGDVSSVPVPVTKSPNQPSMVLEVSDRMYCSACSRSFDSREEQTEHYRLDWHRFNLKQRLLGRQMLTAEEFEMKTQAGDVSSISGSDSSDSDGECDPSSYQNGEGKASRNQSPSTCSLRSPRVLFRNSQGQLIAIYRCVLNTTKGSMEHPAEILASLQKQSPRITWVILMAGGGHFAGAVFKGNEVLEHKTFHRYTVRARRGTAQGVRDAQGSMPKSAGASLRRYNEAALLKDIQELLVSWAGHLQEAECIFLRAPRNNRAHFFGSKNGPLQRNDPRIRGIPFSTRRATFHEVQRVHGVLSSLQVYGKDTTVTDLIGSPRKSWKKVVDEASSQSQDTALRPLSGKAIAEDTKAQGILPQIENGFSKEFLKKGLWAEKHPIEDRVSPAGTEEEGESGEKSPKQLETVEMTFSTLELREFEVAPKRNLKKKRKKPKAFTESSSKISGGAEGSEALLPKSDKSAETQKELEAQDAPSTSVEDALFTACKVGDVGALQHLLGIAGSTKEELAECSAMASQHLLNTPLDESGWTVLHVAAAAGRSTVVRLLLETGADPTLRDRQEQPPYCVSANKQTRAEFRRFMGEQPEKYDYVRAQVPGPLTAEMEARQAERRRAQKAQRKQREKEEREAMQVLKQEEDEKRRFALLSDREKRALAAEKRLVSQLKDSSIPLSNTRRCWLCGESLLGRIPFHYLDFSFCSTKCLQTHRQGRAAPS